MKNRHALVERLAGAALIVLVGLLFAFEGNARDEPRWVRGILIPLGIFGAIVVIGIAAYRHRVK